MTNGTTEASRLAAAREVLDRAYGRPSACTETDHDDDLFAPIAFDALPVARPASTRRVGAKRERKSLAAQSNHHDEADEARKNA